VSKNRRSYTPEYKDEAAKMVVELSRPVASVARECGLNEQTLRNWVNVYREAHAGEEPPLNVPEPASGNSRKKSVNSVSKRSFWEK
jgi:transposase